VSLVNRQKLIKWTDRGMIVGLFINTVVVIPLRIHKGYYSDWTRPWLGVATQQVVYVAVVCIIYLVLRRRFINRNH